MIAQGASDPGGAVATARPLDFDHLDEMTLGEERLARELLQLFDRQAGLTLSRIENAPYAMVAVAAHTLTGSARGVGAFAVAHAAEALERAAIEGADLRRAIALLGESVAEARAAIAAHLRAA